MTERTFTAADVTRLRELMQPPRIVPAEGFPPVRLVGDVQLAEALCIAYRIALPLADALTASADREAALREENARLTEALQDADGCSCAYCCEHAKAVAEVFHANAEPQCVMCLAVRTERQKVTALREEARDFVRQIDDASTLNRLSSGSIRWIRAEIKARMPLLTGDDAPSPTPATEGQ